VSIEFPLSTKKTSLGTIFNPVIPVKILTPKGFVTFQFLLDSGADFTLLPKHVADLVGIDLRNAPSTKTFGVEGKGVRVFVGSVTIKIGHEILKIRAFFSERDDAPFLLGRMDLFNKFKIEFDPKRKKIRFTRIG